MYTFKHSYKHTQKKYDIIQHNGNFKTLYFEAKWP